MIFCHLCPNFSGVRGAYVDEFRVRLAENQPQKRVQKRLREYILSCARLNPPAPVFSTLSAVHDCLSVASPSCLYHYIRWNTPLNPSSDNSHLLDFQILFADYILYILTQSRQTINQKNLTQSLSTFSSNNASCFLTHSSPAVTPAPAKYGFLRQPLSGSFPQKSAYQ